MNALAKAMFRVMAQFCRENSTDCKFCGINSVQIIATRRVYVRERGATTVNHWHWNFSGQISVSYGSGCEHRQFPLSEKQNEDFWAVMELLKERFLIYPPYLKVRARILGEVDPDFSYTFRYTPYKRKKYHVEQTPLVTCEV